MNAEETTGATTIWDLVGKAVSPVTAKTSAAFFTALYVLGLLVTNEASIAIGETAFALPKYQALFTGAWSAAIILVGTLPLDLCYSWMATTRGGPIKIAMLPLTTVSGYFVSIFAAWMILLFIGISSGTPKHLMDLPSVAVLGTPLRVPAFSAWIPLIFLGLAVALWVARRYVRSQFRLILIFGIGSLFSTWILATSVFPFIPKQFGGGWPESVRLILTPEGSKVWAALCSTMSPSSTSTGTVLLVVSKKDTYKLTLTLPKGTDGARESRAITTELHKTFVTGIVNRPDDDIQSCALR
jgi:hypothetical protein